MEKNLVVAAESYGFVGCVGADDVAVEVGFAFVGNAEAVGIFVGACGRTSALMVNSPKKGPMLPVMPAMLLRGEKSMVLGCGCGLKGWLMPIFVLFSC